MAASTLLLLFLTVPAYCYVFQPRSTVTDTAGVQSTGLRGDELMDSPTAADTKSRTLEHTEIKMSQEAQRNNGQDLRTSPIRRPVRKEMEEDGLTPEESLEVHSEWKGKRGIEIKTRPTEGKKKIDSNTERKGVDALQQIIFQEERESKLVAGLHLQDLTSGREMQEGQWKNLNRALSTFTAQLETQPGVTSTSPVTPLPQESITSQTDSIQTIHRLVSSESTDAASADPKRSLIEDLLPELFYSPKHSVEEDLTRTPSHLQEIEKNTRLSKTAHQTSHNIEESSVSPNRNDSIPEKDPTTTASPKNGTKSGPKKTFVKVGRESIKTKGSRHEIRNKIQQFEGTTTRAFPYFKDDYCPPDCTCYGRVVQCSDKQVDKVPYGIPFNSRYILLMNNHIDSIQLDLLKEYASLEFLVLSNNRLTDGSIEGAFEGMPALKRLYLDRNQLLSVPADLPISLEELRLEQNQLRVMSEAAWTSCPGLLVLGLSNNSLGSGSGSLPKSVLSPLRQLRTLNLDHNQLTSVPLGLPLSVKELYLRGNHIKEFQGGAFNGISQLMLLDLSSNRLTNKGLPRDALINTTHLESLNLEGNVLKQVPRHLPLSLKTLNLEGNLIGSINKKVFNNMKNLENLSLSRNKIAKVVPGAFMTLSALHQLDLCYNALNQVPRQLPHGLQWVTLTHNKIQSISQDAFCWGDVSLSGLIQVQLEHNLIDMGKLDSRAFRCLRGPQIVRFY